MLAAFRSVMLIVGLLVFSQAPEFLQQYRQRLGGAVDELSRLVAQIDQDAAAEGLHRDEAIVSYLNSGSDFLARRGVRMRDLLSRQMLLANHQRELQHGGLIAGLWAIASTHDAMILTASWSDFRMAIPVTPDGLVLATAGACTGWVFGGVLGWLLALPFRRSRQPMR